MIAEADREAEVAAAAAKAKIAELEGKRKFGNATTNEDTACCRHIKG